MRAILVIILLSSQFDSFAHGNHMATQNFTFSDSIVVLEFKIAVSTLGHYSQELFGDDFNMKKGFILTNYINSKVDLVMDDTDIQFDLVGSHQNQDYLILTLEAPLSVNDRSKATITSNAFYEAAADFENRVIITKTNGTSSSYRLTKAKNRLEATL